MIQGFRCSEKPYLFFTSDTHFNDPEIIKYCNRPFKSVGEMNEILIENWNKKVGVCDYVFHLGDFGIGNWTPILDRLNGIIYLMIGNHDMEYMKTHPKIKYTDMQSFIRVGKRGIYLNHYPFLCYGGSYMKPLEAIWQFHGHTHTRPDHSTAGIENQEVKEILDKDHERMKLILPTQIDVGVDNWNYTPVSYLELENCFQHRFK